MVRKRSGKRGALIVALVFLLTMVFNSTSYAALVGAGDLIKNSTFDNDVGLPWHVVESYPADADFDIKDGKYYITINNKGTNRWDVQFRHRGLTLENQHWYTVKFTVSSTKNCEIFPKIGEQGPPYNDYWNYNQNYSRIPLTANTPVTITQQFQMTSTTSKTCEFTFHIAGDVATSPLPYTLTFDDIHLLDPQFQGYEPDPPEPTNAIRVNQNGYFPELEKKATLVSNSTSPVAWKLLNSAGTVVANGQTTVKGSDHASGDNVHIIDFSSYKTEGKGYKLVVDSGSASATPAESFPFDISKSLYTQMKYDSIKYFYHNRSGIEIKMPYADRDDLKRPAGHPNDVLPNAKDTWYKESYTLDITGGWYDAGDHGKYIVNGGISTWTMYNEYERALLKGNVKVAPFADNTMNIPESGNGVPDILDEARWNTELFLKMQVKTGAYAGMVHHKAHDERWTALAIRPDQDPMDRYLQPPSTAATLNFAAVTAQASRLWKPYDATFANKTLTASEVAWDAAVKNPAIYAPMTGGTGGGAYGDDNVTDEFYWAAAELYITTGKAKYLDFLKSSPHYLKSYSKLTGGEDKGLTGAFDWGNVAGMGTIDLALVPNNLPSADIATARANIMSAADTFINIENKEGYGSPIEESPTTGTLVGYPWGSNSFIVNEAILMSYAYEFSDRKATKYLSGATGAMDYILGRNPNVQSYITGYGENPLENPHHRFWAFQADNTFPKAPAGCLSGGPNSGLEDPWVKGSGWKPGARAAQKCFMDNIESWSTNEITINWNAPLAWITAYLDEQGPLASSSTVLLGDVNKDKFVDALDLSAIKVYLLTKNPEGVDLVASDVNLDNAVDALDFALIKQYLLKIISHF